MDQIRRGGSVPYQAVHSATDEVLLGFGFGRPKMTHNTNVALKCSGIIGSEFALAAPSFVPTKLFFGLGSSAAFADILADVMLEQGGRKILLLTGAPGEKKNWMETFESAVGGFDHIVVRNTVSNPTLGSVSEVLEIARAAGVDTVVAVGGGSVLDTGKAVAALARSDLSIEDAIAQKSVSDIPLNYLAVPTTSGTGSEVTSYATIWDDKAKAKYSLSTPAMYPMIALIDPSLGASMPQEIAAGTGLDALSHAMESCWSINSTDESIELGLAAIELVIENLETAVLNPENERALADISLASLYAGMSIAQGQTTISHAISYPLTARYGIHHGHACGASVGSLLRFNDQVSPEDCQDVRGYQHVRSVLDRIIDALSATDAASAERRILDLMGRIGLRTFDQFHEVDLALLAEDVIGYDRFGNNPRRMSADQLVEFLGSLGVAKHV